MQQDNQIPSLSQFLTINGWVVINDNLMIFDERNLIIKIEDEKLNYLINKEIQKEIPLEIAIHHYRHLIPEFPKYENAIKLINTLKRRKLEVCYDYSNYRWNGNDEYWDWAGFYLISIRTEESYIILENDGYIKSYTRWNDGIYNEDEIVKAIIIELGLLINPDFHYNKINDRFEISELNKRKVVKENKDYFSSF